MNNKFQEIRSNMERIGVTDPDVVGALLSLSREDFIEPQFHRKAYIDAPLSIDKEQTISQPSLVAYMTQELKLNKNLRVLEIGTGCGYQTAMLASLAKEVYTVEVIESLSKASEARLERLGFHNIQFRIGDGHLGWSEQSPFDRIIVTASAREIPPALTSQLKVGGRMVIPVEDELLLITKSEEGTQKKRLMSVRFVPLVGTETPR